MPKDKIPTSDDMGNDPNDLDNAIDTGCSF